MYPKIQETHFPGEAGRKCPSAGLPGPGDWGVPEEDDGWSGSGTPSLGNHWAQGGDMPVRTGSSSSTVEPELSQL